MASNHRKYKAFMDRAADYLREKEGEEVSSTDLPALIRQKKNGRRFRNPPPSKGMHNRLKNDKRFVVKTKGGKSTVSIRRRDEDAS